MVTQQGPCTLLLVPKCGANILLGGYLDKSLKGGWSENWKPHLHNSPGLLLRFPEEMRLDNYLAFICRVVCTRGAKVALPGIVETVQERERSRWELERSLVIRTESCLLVNLKFCTLYQSSVHQKFQDTSLRSRIHFMLVWHLKGLGSVHNGYGWERLVSRDAVKSGYTVQCWRQKPLYPLTPIWVMWLYLATCFPPYFCH